MILDTTATAPVAAGSERAILRDLAKRVAEIASLPIQAERIELWKAVNRLEPIRPVVAIYPERAWEELVPHSCLQCQDPMLQRWEMFFRQTIFQHDHIPDDRPLTSDVLIKWALSESECGIEFKIRHSDGDGPEAYTWEPPIKTMADMDVARVPDYSVDREYTHRRYERAQELFGDILNVSIWGGQPIWSIGFSQLIMFRGLQQAMLDMYEQPEMLHRILEYVQAKQTALMDFLENENLLGLNNGPTKIDYFMGSGHEGYTDELPAPDFDGRVRWKDMWGLGEMQEFSGVGPEHFWEFSLLYQLPLLNRFGLVNYGCCEPLDAVYDMLIDNIPNLRRLSVTSPYASKRIAAEALTDKYIYSWKPNPTPLATASVDWEWIERDTRETLDIARGGCLEIILKSTETFNHDPARVTQWAELARRLACESVS
jgi:hypothetical protein